MLGSAATAYLRRRRGLCVTTCVVLISQDRLLVMIGVVTGGSGSFHRWLTLDWYPVSWAPSCVSWSASGWLRLALVRLALLRAATPALAVPLVRLICRTPTR